MSTNETKSLEELKVEADGMNINYHPSIGVEKLALKIFEFKANAASFDSGAPAVDPSIVDPNTGAGGEPTPNHVVEVASVVDAGGIPQPVKVMVEREMTSAEIALEKAKAKRILYAKLRKQQTKLIRVVIHCNNVTKSEFKGQFVTVSNAVVGTYRKYVPFDIENGWHIPQIMLDTMQDKMCQKFKTVKNADGIELKVGYLTKEFTIEILPPLTEKELLKLADAQKAKGSFD